MATLEDALYSLLAANAGVAAILGDRIYPNVAAQGCTRPYAVYHLISQVRFPAMGVDARVVERRVQIDVFGVTQTDAISAGAAITAALNRAGGVYAGVTIQQAFEAGMQDFGQDEDTRLFRRGADYLIWYED